jgi:hypothetical protein
MKRKTTARDLPRAQDRHSQAAVPAAAGSKTTMADVAAAVLLAIGAAFENHRARTAAGNAKRAWITPIVIVNYVAFRAQLRFWQDHLSPADALLVSVALESIAIYWAYQAHQAIMADDSALRLKMAAYGMALIIGVLNYSHYMHPHWRPTVAAVTFGMMSVISPWLWSANSRRSSRDVLKDKNLIEDHAVRLGLTRWFWHGWRCIHVMHAATWEGVNRPSEAIRLWQSRRDRLAARKALDSQPYPAQDDVPDVRKVTRTRSRKAVPAAAAQTPPPVPGEGEPRPADAAANGRAKAPSPGLAAARTRAEEDLVRQLIEDGRPFPAIRALARHDALEGSESTRRRRARDLIALAAAGGAANHHV